MSLVDLQAKSMELPLIKISTEGEKEKELNDLEKALKLAKKKYNINGIITGALFSTYQRDRVEIIADKLGLKVFSPLWHKDQYLEVLETINLGIKPVITKIAAYGLDKSYLGKVIDKELLEHLNKLNNKFGFNIAGEGGEYETTVIDAPLFKQPIDLNKLNKKIKEIDQYTAELIIE
jgi:asparagine synthase (glutamine-hydrolysing)